MYNHFMYPDEIYHHGVLGMHWGIRRYQNYDGSRIKGGPVKNPKYSGHPQSISRGSNAGESSESSSGKRSSAKDVAETLVSPTVKQGKGRENISPAEDITKKATRLTESGKRLSEIGEKHDKKTQQKNEEAYQKQMDKAKKMSDKELRDSINRIKMEREYSSLTSEKTESGWKKAQEVLEVTKEVAEITGIIVSIIGSIITIKNAVHKAGDIPDDEADELMRLLNLDGIPGDVIAHALDLDEEYIMHAYDIQEDVEDYLAHHGVLGMKWGVRRYQNYDGTRIGSGEKPVINKAKQTNLDKDGNARPSGSAVGAKLNAGKSRMNDFRDKKAAQDKTVYNKGKKMFSNAGSYPISNGAKLAAVSDKPKVNVPTFGSSGLHNKAAKAAQRDADDLRKHGYNEEADAVEATANRHREIAKEKSNRNERLAAMSNPAASLAAKRLGKDKPKVRADGKDESKFTPQQKQISKDARKDAEEFARAKAFYGEGAGNRRKAIKTTVEAKKKKDKFYAEEFEYHLSQQDMEQHMKAAKSERARKDTVKGARKAVNTAEKLYRMFG